MAESVLIVDDEKDLLEIMAERLRNRGMNVSTTTSALNALKMAEAESYDAVVLDLMMPEMDGFEFVEKYRENPDWHDIPIIVLTAKTLTEDDRHRLDGWVKEMYSKGDSNIEQVLNEVCALLPPKE